MPRISRRRSGGAKRKKRTYWGGIQWPDTGIPGNPSRQILVVLSAQSVEFMSRTAVRIRGFITYMNQGANADLGQVRIVSKLMLVRVDDAGAVPADYIPIDTNEEDIADRQGWTYSTTLKAAPVLLNAEGPTQQVEVDIKAKFRMPSDGKHILVLLSSASASSRALTSGYLRCLTER